VKKKATRRKKPAARKRKPAGRKATASKSGLKVEGLSLKEINKLESELQKAKIEARERVKQELKKKIDALLEGTGIGIHDIYGIPQPKRKGKTSTGVAKYANPEDPTDTWTGRGRKPNWLLARLKKGAKLEQFAI
jgi:DNA-binding protein H-NS